MFLPLLGGCVGVYGEVAATTYPSAQLGSGAGASTSGSSVGFNVGVDFGNAKKRFALGYEQTSLSVKDGSASMGASSARLDYSVLSISDRAKVRIGGAFGFGSGTSKNNGMSQDANGGGAYAGVGFTYFPTWHVGVHAFAGPAFSAVQMPGGDFSGTGATFRLAVTYQFADIRTDVTKLVPLENATDITGLLEVGAKQLGCTTFRRSSDTYAYLDITCSDDQLSYFQIAEGMMVECKHMSEGACDALSARVLDAAKKALPAPLPTTAPAPAAVPAAAPAAPAATPAPSQEPAKSEGQPGESLAPPG